VHTAIERRVAIKVLHPEFAVRPEFVGRFFNEARAVNRVDHPGLVQISDYGQQPDGTAYIVMEYLRGESLSARLKREGALRIREGLRLCAQVADSLAAAHEKGIVHRDLKPDNIMIVADANVEGGERTKLLDFGIAKLTEGDEIVKTKTDAMMGTPLYMSPEQCRGAGGVDARSDVYALGVLLFDVFAGTPPFAGAGFGEIIAQHLFQEPPSLGKLAPDLPAQVTALVMRLLVKDKAQRPAMREVAAELAALAKRSTDKPRPAEVTARRAAPSDATATHGSASEQVTRTLPTKGLGGRALSALGALGLCGAALAYFWLLRPAGNAASAQAPATGASSAGPPAASAGSKTLGAGAALLPWAIDSEPPGASVLVAEDNTLLCQTPCRLKEAPRSEPVRLRLQQAGYADRTIVVDATRPVQRHEILDPAPSTLTKPAPDPARGPASASGKSPRGPRTSSGPGPIGGAAASVTSSPTGSSAAKPTERAHARPKIED
jgi:serine/threonine-protein kinase